MQQTNFSYSSVKAKIAFYQSEKTQDVSQLIITEIGDEYMGNVSIFLTDQQLLKLKEELDKQLAVRAALKLITTKASQQIS